MSEKLLHPLSVTVGLIVGPPLVILLMLCILAVG